MPSTLAFSRSGQSCKPETLKTIGQSLLSNPAHRVSVAGRCREYGELNTQANRRHPEPAQPPSGASQGIVE
jgi:hypothetical protein